jgi:membrane protein required for beta-lactamase induction
VQEKASVVNRLHKVLEWANLKLASVVTDLTGVSARKMLAAIVNGEVDEATLVDLAKVASALNDSSWSKPRLAAML